MLDQSSKGLIRIISNKHTTYELPHEMLNELRLPSDLITTFPLILLKPKFGIENGKVYLIVFFSER